MIRHRSLVALLYLSGLIPTVHAAPTVSDNVISWPDDGWYQVQRSDNFASLCEGGRKCTVPDGKYIVINHTTGERFTDIVVTGMADSDKPPVLNDSVRAVLYPGAGGELFWERATDDRGIAGYEVTFNGQLLVTLDALSYYLPQLVPDIAFRFTVTAIDTSGQRSETYSANLGVDEEPVTNPPEDTLAPSLITEAIYSSTASELFWQVPAFTIDNPITSNEIRRNSQLIATLPGYFLRSYFDGDRTAGVRYVYEITSIYADGERASATFTSATGPITPVEPLTDTNLPDDVYRTLNQAFALINADAMETAAASALSLISSDNSGLTQLSSELDDSGSNRITRYVCEGGGNLTVFSGFDPSDLFGWRTTGGCRIGSTFISGNFVLSDSPTTPGEFVLFISEFQWGDERDSSRISFDDQFAVRIGEPTAVRANGELSATTPQGSYSVGGLNVLHNFSPLPDGTLGTTISAQDINSATIQGSIRTFLAFNSGDQSGRPTSGTLIIGPTIVGDVRLDADSGNRDTFLLTVRNGEVTTTYIVPWSMRFAIDPVETNGFVLGQ